MKSKPSYAFDQRIVDSLRLSIRQRNYCKELLSDFYFSVWCVDMRPANMHIHLNNVSLISGFVNQYGIRAITNL